MGVRPDTATQWCATGGIPGEKHNNTWYLPDKVANRYVELGFCHHVGCLNLATTRVFEGDPFIRQCTGHAEQARRILGIGAAE